LEFLVLWIDEEAWSQIAVAQRKKSLGRAKKKG
jgi:hypothetical protein